MNIAVGIIEGDHHHPVRHRFVCLQMLHQPGQRPDRKAVVPQKRHLLAEQGRRNRGDRGRIRGHMVVLQDDPMTRRQGLYRA